MPSGTGTFFDLRSNSNVLFGIAQKEPKRLLPTDVGIVPLAAAASGYRVQNGTIFLL